jgi:hypothetical protein
VNEYQHIIDLLCHDIDNEQTINNECVLRTDSNLVSDNRHIVSDNSSLFNFNLVQTLKGDCVEGLADNHSTEKTDALKCVITGVNCGGQDSTNDMVDNLNLVQSDINICEHDNNVCYNTDLKPSAFVVRGQYLYISLVLKCLGRVILGIFPIQLFCLEMCII